MVVTDSIIQVRVEFERFGKRKETCSRLVEKRPLSVARNQGDRSRRRRFSLYADMTCLDTDGPQALERASARFVVADMRDQSDWSA